MGVHGIGSRMTVLPPVAYGGASPPAVDGKAVGRDGAMAFAVRPASSVRMHPVTSSGPSSSSSGESPEFVSESGMAERVLAGIDSVGSVPAQVSVYSQPMGGSIMTDVVVHQTSSDDGTRKIGNHWSGGTIPVSSASRPEGIGPSGMRVGAYEDSRAAAREAAMMFQGMKVNQTA